MTAIVTLDNVTVTYDDADRPAVSMFNLGIDPGQLVLLAGPSGCGKSTVTRVINGLIPSAFRARLTGSFLIDGIQAAGREADKISETVGTLLQDPGRQVVGHSVMADIAFGMENRAMPADVVRSRIRSVATTLEIDDELLSADTSELSGGQLQLIAIAGVLVRRPRLIIVDEPLANLDSHIASRIMRIIRQYVDAGNAAIVIEHRVADVVSLAPDAVVYLENGHTSYSGDLAGFLRAAEPAAVKLPFSTLLARAEDSLRPQHNESSMPTGSGTVLRYHKAVIGYGSSPAIHNVTTTFTAGQRISVVGPNGAGKTTLLRAAAGLVDVIRGSVELRDKPVEHYRAAELPGLCCYLFEDPAQALFAPTIAEELAVGPRHLGMDAIEIARISAGALKAVGLDPRPAAMLRPPRTLSFGEQRRLALAVALVLEPKTLILDEPTAGQDERSLTTFFDAIWALPRIDSVFFITHDVELALWLSDRMIVIDRGRIIADGNPSEVVHDQSLWYYGHRPRGRSVLRESAYVRAVRHRIEPTGRIPPPRELARLLGAAYKEKAKTRDSQAASCHYNT